MLPQRRSPGIFGWLVAFVIVLLLVLFAVEARSAPVDPSGDIALVTGKVYPTPQAAPILGAVVLIHNPATFFKAGKTGKVLRGYDADLVVLGADPATDIRNFAKVEYTIRAGKIIYKK